MSTEFKVGDIVRLNDTGKKDYPDNTPSNPHDIEGKIQQIKSKTSYDFSLENCEGWSFIQENFVKKVDAFIVTAHLTDVPSTFLFGKDSLTAAVQQFNAGDEVEVINSHSPIIMTVSNGTIGKIITIEGNIILVQFDTCNQTCRAAQLKLINNNKIDNNGKVHSTTTNDIRTAFSPDIRSKEICTGQVFSEFNLPQIWSGH